MMNGANLFKTSERTLAKRRQPKFQEFGPVICFRVTRRLTCNSR